MQKPIMCLDFDGVIHRYDSGWTGATVISDGVTDGFFEWLDKASKLFRIVIYSSRSSEPKAVEAMALWMAEQRRLWRAGGGQSVNDESGFPVQIEFADKKPAAFLTIDDRAITFEGDWSKLDPEMLLSFRPWNKRERGVQ